MCKTIKQLFIILLLCLSCSPVIKLKPGNSATIANGKFSCYGGICCWPYLHHREVKEYHFMFCADQSSDIMGIVQNSPYDSNGYNSLRISTKAYFLHP
jgi:hypothetical protein